MNEEMHMSILEFMQIAIQACQITKAPINNQIPPPPQIIQATPNIQHHHNPSNQMVASVDYNDLSIHTIKNVITNIEPYHSSSNQSKLLDSSLKFQECDSFSNSKQEIKQSQISIQKEESSSINYDEDDMFTDFDFLADDISLGDNIGKKCIWIRASELVGRKLNLCDNISPFDALQGELGDCYFLSAISALARHPEIIAQLFENKGINSQGRYKIRLFINGTKSLINIDDYIPCKEKNGTPLFSQPHQNKIWVMLLEKAWAKVHGNYSNIISGVPCTPIRMLTGAPYNHFEHISFKDDINKLWNLIIKSINANHLVFTSTSILMSNVGMIDNHSHCVLLAKVLKLKGKEVRLLKIRNPWGTNKWSKSWKNSDGFNWTKDAKEQMQFDYGDKGTFHMCFEDYIHYFSVTDISYVCDKYSPTFAKLGHKIGNYSACILSFAHNTRGYIYATYLDHEIKNSKIPQFQNFEVRGGLWQNMGNNEYKFLKRICSISSYIHIIDDEPLFEGEYLFLAECNSEGPLITNQIILCCYAEKAPTIRDATPVSISILEKLMSAVSLVQNDKILFKENSNISAYFNFMKGGISICSFTIYNKSKAKVLMKIILNTNKVQMIPLNNSVGEFIIEAPKMTDTVALFKVDPSKMDYGFSYIYKVIEPELSIAGLLCNQKYSNQYSYNSVDVDIYDYSFYYNGIGYLIYANKSANYRLEISSMKLILINLVATGGLIHTFMVCPGENYVIKMTPINIWENTQYRTSIGTCVIRKI